MPSGIIERAKAFTAAWSAGGFDPILVSAERRSQGEASPNNRKLAHDTSGGWSLVAQIRVLIGSPVRQKPAILREFLSSLLELVTDGMDVDFTFIDDNDMEESSQLLHRFRPSRGAVTILPAARVSQEYKRNDITHYWREDLIWRVAAHKENMIDLAKQNAYDYLFLVDSDVVLHPWTLLRLLETGKDIISEIFWTRWQPGSPELPQVWLTDQYTLFARHRGETLTSEEIERRTQAFLAQLRQPGVYRVGGLGACTLISRRAITAGVSFKELYNVSFWGEDRHFCIRAVALGFDLFVDTTYPAYHVYRDADLTGVSVFKEWTRLQTAILAVAKRAIEAYGTTHYETITGLEALPWLAPKLREKLLAEQQANVSSAKKAHLISTAKASNLVICDLDETAGFARVRCQITSSGVENGIEFNDKFMAEVTVEKVDSHWLVGDVAFEPIKVTSDDPGPESGASSTDSHALGRGQNAPIVVIRRRARSKGNRLTLSMLVRNEADRYLRRVLSHARCYIDEAVILDDASDDDTVEVCREILEGIPLKLVSNREPGFYNEVQLRKQQWSLTVETNPDWVLFLDADEIFEERAKEQLRSLIEQAEYDYFAFRLYDFWDEEYYREDSYWQAHKTYRPLLIRYQPEFPYVWKETPLHCGRIPWNVTWLRGAVSELRVKHYGWATERDRVWKYQRYIRLDRDGRYGIMEQYRSIVTIQVPPSRPPHLGKDMLSLGKPKRTPTPKRGTRTYPSYPWMARRR